MAKKKSLQDDANTLKTKVRKSVRDCENPEGDAQVRALRKRLKRAQRKVRAIRRRAEGPTTKKAKVEA